MMLLVFAKSHVKGHYRTDPTTHEQVYVKPHEDGRKASSEPFRMWRVQGGTIRHAVPGQSITPQQAEQLIEKMKRAGAVTEHGEKYDAVLGKHGYKHQGAYMGGREHFGHGRSSKHDVLVSKHGWEHQQGDGKDFKNFKSTKGTDADSLDRHLSTVHKKTS